MVNFSVQIPVFRNESGVMVKKTHYEGSCNTSDVTLGAGGETATIQGTPTDAAGGSGIVVIENKTVFLFDEENTNWHKMLVLGE